MAMAWREVDATVKKDDALVVCITVLLHHGVGIVFDKVTPPRDNATARCIMMMGRAVTDRDRYLTGYAERS